jgi:hypothetical protein
MLVASRCRTVARKNCVGILLFVIVNLAVVFELQRSQTLTQPSGTTERISKFESFEFEIWPNNASHPGQNNHNATTAMRQLSYGTAGTQIDATLKS